MLPRIAVLRCDVFVSVLQPKAAIRAFRFELGSRPVFARDLAVCPISSRPRSSAQRKNCFIALPREINAHHLRSRRPSVMRQRRAGSYRLRAHWDVSHARDFATQVHRHVRKRRRRCGTGHITPYVEPGTGDAGGGQVAVGGSARRRADAGKPLVRSLFRTDDRISPGKWNSHQRLAGND